MGRSPELELETDSRCSQVAAKNGRLRMIGRLEWGAVQWCVGQSGRWLWAGGEWLAAV